MKKLVSFVIIFLAAHTWALPITISESAGWLESAFVKWASVTGVDSYNVYYSGAGITSQKIDNQLIRCYGDYFRADVLGLKAGTYTIKVVPVTKGVEGTGTASGSLTVIAHDRSGFAFHGGVVPGAYNADGTPKDGALIIYITENTKNTISDSVNKANANPCIGLETILEGFAKGYDLRPLIIRFVGQITNMSYMDKGDIVVGNKNNSASYITLEGVGDDAVADGWGIRIKGGSNVEIRNIGLMNTTSDEGDDIGLQQDNEHIWVHNCDYFYGNPGGDGDQAKGDGSLDCKLSKYITFSYNHFWDNGKCNLLGLKSENTTDYFITYHHNWYDHSDSRHPRIRLYSAHVYNNYYDGNAKYGAGSTMGSSVFEEGNYFRNCEHPMMTSLQGTDVWNSTTQKNDPSNKGTFSGETGGTIKEFKNIFDTSIGTNNMRFVAYGDPDPAFNITGVISSTIDFDAYAAKTRAEQVPVSVKSFSGANTYNNFDTRDTLYVKTLSPDAPDIAKTNVMKYSGRINGGDFKWTFNNLVDDTSSAVNTALKGALTDYKTSLVSVQGVGVVGVKSNKHPVTKGVSIASRGKVEKVEVYNLEGVLVKSAKANFKTTDISNLSRGSYLIREYTKNGLLNQHFIKNDCR